MPRGSRTCFQEYGAIPLMDKTILNLATILITGAGVSAVLMKYSVPQLNMTFWGENPFAVKRDIVEGVMARLFTGLAVAGLLIQAWLLILGDELPDREYGEGTYLLIFGCGVLVVAVLIFALAKLGLFIAKKRWFPKIISSQRDLYMSVQPILANDGWSDDQLRTKDGLQDGGAHIRAANFKTLDKNLTQMEELFELKPTLNNRLARLERLRPFFEA